MMRNDIRPGDVLLLSFPIHIPKGHEQEGKRPVIVVSVPKEPVRYPVVIVVPLTTKDGKWVDQNPDLYYRIPAGNGGLTKNSIVLLDQICAVDINRIESFIGKLKKDIFDSIYGGNYMVERGKLKKGKT